MLMLDDVLEEKNISRALKRVIHNKGVGGVDNMSVDELTHFWEKYGDNIIDNIRRELYVPQPMMCMYISKKGGKKKRRLSIPTVLDRMIQQAIMQKLAKEYGKEFDSHSFGYRKGKSTKDALKLCLKYMNEGYEYVVDIDIEAFFDNVNHDILLGLLRKRDIDEKLIRLIEKYIKYKILCGGRISKATKGISQGSPLSPLLANVLLNELDRFVTDNFLHHIRYADDILVMTESEDIAVDVMWSIREFLMNILLLDVNTEKSQIVKADKLEYMEYAFKKKDTGKYVLTINDNISDKAIRRIEKHTNASMKDIVAWWNRIGSFNRGWLNYYKYADDEDLIRTIRQIELKCDEFIEQRLVDISENTDIDKETIIYSIFDAKQFVNIKEWYEFLKNREDGFYDR